MRRKKGNQVTSLHRGEGNHIFEVMKVVRFRICVERQDDRSNGLNMQCDVEKTRVMEAAGLSNWQDEMAIY